MLVDGDYGQALSFFGYPRWIEPEGSEAFVAGYRHGCQSGRHEYDPQLTFRIRDPDRYASDEEYTEGWDEEFSLCYEQEKSIPHCWGATPKCSQWNIGNGRGSVTGCRSR